MFFIGVDLGQRHDHSAIVMLHRPHSHALSTTREKLIVRCAERLPLGLAYPDVVECIRHVVGRASVEGCRLAVDATGVGRPVVDLLRRANLDCHLMAVTITSGNRQNYRPGETSSMNVPKQDLIGGLHLALEKGELRIAAKLRESGTLKRELMNVRMQRRDTGYQRFGADGYGQHDDLVIALALAHWRSTRY